MSHHISGHHHHGTTSKKQNPTTLASYRQHMPSCRARKSVRTISVARQQLTTSRDREHIVSRLRTVLLITTLAVIAFATTATLANAALPSVLLLTGTTATLVAESGTASTKLVSYIDFLGEGYRVELNAPEVMTSLGKGNLWLKNVEASTTKCSSSGDTAGSVLVPIEWHTVLTEGGSAKLFLLLLLIVPALNYACGAASITLSGSILMDAEEFARDTTSFTASTGKCNGASPAYKEYDNDAGALTKSRLIVEVGGIKLVSCEEINGGGNIDLTSSTMLEVMEP
jgi:hypothetical protein